MAQIVFVDEDESQTWAWRAELELRGHHVEYIRTADGAFAYLTETDLGAIDLVVVDVMLAVGDARDERFDFRTTDLYHETGLVLLRDLVQQLPDFAAKCLLFTNTTGARLAKAEAAAVELGARLLRKTSVASPHEFGETVEAMIGVS